jgi:hypothetical protein
MFRLITAVKTGNGVGSGRRIGPRIPASRRPGAGASALMREDRVLRVMVVRNDITRTFVEWSDR